MGFGQARDVQRLFVLLQTALLLFDHLLRGSDQGLHLAGLSRGLPIVVAMVTLARVAGGAPSVRRTYDAVLVPVAPSCKEGSTVTFRKQSLTLC